MPLADLIVPGRDGAPEDRAELSSRHRATLAILLIGWLTWCAAGSIAVRMPAFYGVDEPAHLGYAASLLAGQLPEIEDPLPRGEFAVLDLLAERYQDSGGGPNGRDVVWVANHPPAYYLVAAPFAAAGAGAIGPNGALLGMRFVSVTCMALTAVAVGALAGRLVPGRPAVAVGAAAFFSLTAQVPNVGAFAYSDPIALLTWVLGLAVAIEVVRRPPERLSRWLAAVAAVVAIAAAGSRASLLPIVLTIAVAWAVAAVLAARDGFSPRRALEGLAGSVVGPVLAVGPWYLRNDRLYGSITADRYLLHRFHRRPVAHASERLVTVDFWHQAAGVMWSRMREGVEVARSLWVLATVALVAVALGLWSVRRRRRAPTLRGFFSWAAATCASLVLLYGVSRFMSAGGSLHIRYLLPLVPVVAVLVAAGLAPRHGRPWVLVGAVVVVAPIQGLMLWRLPRLLPVEAGVIGVPVESWSTAASRG